MCGITCVLALTPTPSPTTQRLASRSPANDHTNGVNGHHNPKKTNEHARAALFTELTASMKQIRHRGPDSEGQWISDDNRVALGHVRLSINDLHPTGAQPMHSPGPNAHVHVIVNGELYDYDRLRKQLEAEPSNYVFSSNSDSELVVALYLTYGLGFTEYLRGEFACIVYDEKRKFFLAARDRYGIKPLFWTMQQGRLLVASEMKAFLPLGWQPEWDVGSLRGAGWNHDVRTVFRGVQKIRPGHILTCQSFGPTEERPYWDSFYPDKRMPDPRTPEELIQGVRALMLDSVRQRLRADVPIGIYLSGGIDSSAIAGMVSHLISSDPSISVGSRPASERVTCFSIAFPATSGYDESAIAERTAEHLGVKYLRKLMDEEALAERFEEAVWHCEQHNPDLNFVGKFALSEVPREAGYKVVLTGEGADEIFGGYPVYLPDYLREPDLAWEAHNPLPESERTALLHSAEDEAREHYRLIGADAGDGSASLPRRMLNNISTVSSMAAFQPDVFASWTSSSSAADENPEQTIADNVSGSVRSEILNTWHPLHSALYVWGKGHLPNIFLTCLGDRTEMAHSIEARTPFLDHHLTAYVNNLPPSTKLRYDPARKAFTEKWILREAAKPFITEELYARKKHPYSAPTTWPRHGPLHRLLAGLVTRESIAELGFVGWYKVDGLVDRAFGEQADVAAMRKVLVVAEWVVIGRRFGVKTAVVSDWS